MNNPDKRDQIEEIEDFEQESSDIEAIGPSIAAGKKNKMVAMVGLSVFVTFVLYLFIFKGDSTPEKPQEDSNLRVEQIATQSEEPISPFELEEFDGLSAKENAMAGLESPAIPEIPVLELTPEQKALQESFNNAIAAEQRQEIVNNQNPINQQQNQAIANVPSVADLALPSSIFNNQQPTSPNASNNTFGTNNSRIQNPDLILGDSGTNKSISNKALNELDNRYSPIVVFSGGSKGTNKSSVGYEKNIVNLTKDSLGDLKETKSEIQATYIADRANTIAQGKLLTAILETAINTEVPGFVRAIVSRDVYGEIGNEVLIPRGSRLFGSYSSEIKRGQGRVEIAWQRLIRPDGVDLNVSFNASDQFGRAGIPGEVDNKYGPAIANSMLTSVLAVGSVAAAEALLNQNNSDTTTTTNPTLGTSTTTGSASSQAIYNVSKEIIDVVGEVMRNQINTNPVIRIAQGTRITVIVNSDIKVPFIKGGR